MNSNYEDFVQQFEKEMILNHHRYVRENIHRNINKTKEIYEDLKILMREITDLDIKDKLIDELFDLLDVRSSLIDLTEKIREESLRE